MKNNSKALSGEKRPSGIINKSKGLFSSRKKLAAILVAILILGLGTWRTLGNRNQQPQYQTAQVEKGTIVSSVSASGQVLTANMVNVSTSASGLVKEVYVKEGEQVSAGSKILEVTLDQAGQAASAQAYNLYLSAKTTLDAANANAYSLRSTKDTAWNKFYNLSVNSNYQNADDSPREDQRNSSAEFQSAEADWLAAEAKYKNQQAVIVQTQQAVSSSWLSYQKTSPTVTAPIAGTVSNITVVSGMVLSAQASGDTDTASSGQRVAVVKNDGNSVVSVNLSEVDVPKVEINDKATITLDAITDKTFTGKVVSVDKIGTTSSGVTTYPALIQFDTQSLDILPNMAASANVIVETKNNVLLVPSTAVQTQNGQIAVRVMRNNQVILMSVEVGDSNDTQTEILSGINEGDTVVTGQTGSTTTGSTGATSPFGNTGGFGGGGGGTQIPRR